MKTAPSVELLKYYSHWVTLGNRPFPPIEKEEVYLHFLTEWRGDPVVVEVECNRHSSGMDRDHQTLNDWRVIVRTPQLVGELDEHGQYPRRGMCTDTARSRVREWVEPAAVAWLDTDAYKASERDAYAFALVRLLGDPRGSVEEPTYRVRQMVAAYVEKLSPGVYDKLLRACDAYDTFDAAKRAIVR